MTTLEAAVALARRDRVLVVISTLRSNLDPRDGLFQ